MQSYSNLNSYSNTSVNYGTWRDYEIQFGNNAGNYSATEYENSLFPITQRANLEVFSDASADLLINLGFSNTVSLDDVVYIGDNANIQVWESDRGNTANYVVTGVRSISDYDEAFDNVFVYTANASLVGFEITTLIDDQRGNTLTYVGNISLISNPGFAYTGNLVFSEDIPANITGFAVQDNVSSNSETYTITFNTGGAANGAVSYSGNTSTVITANLSKSDLANAFSANAFVYIPAADSTANTAIVYQQRRNSDNRIWQATIPATWSGNSHAEAWTPRSQVYQEDRDASISGARTYYLENCSLQTAQKKFGTASLQLRGDLNSVMFLGEILLAGSAAPATSTVEFWIRRDLAPTVATVIFDTVAVGTGWELIYNTNNTLTFRTQDFSSGSSVTRSITTAALTANTWQHVAMVRNTNTFGMWLDGVSAGTFTNTDFRESNTLRAWRSGSGSGLRTWIDDFRVSSVARYTPGNNFTAPTAAFAVDDDTRMLFAFDGAQAAVTTTNAVPFQIRDIRPLEIDATIPYTIEFRSANVARGVIHYGNVDYGTLTLTDTRANLNAILANTGITYRPAADSTAVNTVFYSQRQDQSGIQQITDSPMRLDCVTTHTEYSIPASYSLAEDTTLSMGNISITDLRPDYINANLQYQVTLTSQDGANVKIRYAGLDEGQHIISGTKAQVNAIFGNVSVRPQIVPAPDWSGNTTITYSQTQTTDGVVQAAAVPIGVFVADSAEYSLTTNYIYPVTTNNHQRLIYSVTDLDPTANTYTITTTQTSGATGNFWLNGSDQNSNTITFTGNRATVNAANIAFLPNFANVTAANLTWSLVKTRLDSSNVTIANNVPVTMTPVLTNASNLRNYTSNNRTAIFATGTPVLSTTITGNVTFTVTPDSGLIGTTDANASGLYQGTSSVTIFNSDIDDLLYWPDRGQSGNTTMRIQVTQGGTTWVDRDITLVGSVGNLPANLLGNITITASGTYTPDLRLNQYARANILIIGGGGGGAWGGGGGGGGGCKFFSNVIIPPGGQSVSIGLGGGTQITQNFSQGGYSFQSGNGITGGNTIFLGNTATGGQGGRAAFLQSNGPRDLPNGGNTGIGRQGDNNNFWSGGTGAKSAIPSANVPGWGFTGGGGAGAGSIGSDAIFSNIANVAGSGGNGGIFWSWQGNANARFSAGGGGGSSVSSYGNNGTASFTYGNGGRGAGWFAANVAPQSGQAGAVLIQWYV